MNIHSISLYSILYDYILLQIRGQLTPLQKKVAIVAVAFFSCTALSCIFFHYCFKAEEIEENDKENIINTPSSPLSSPHSVKIFPKVIMKPSIPSVDSEPKVKQEEDLDANPQDDQSDLVDPFSVINNFTNEAARKDDFLSILRCMVDHPEWVEANMEQSIIFLETFGSQACFLQPIKVVADLYEALLEQHPLLAFKDNLKNTDVIFEDNTKYRTHLIFALKNLQSVRDILEEEKPDLFKTRATEQIEIQLPGSPTVLKAVLQYLDKSDSDEIEKESFFQLIKIANQYNIPSLWRYCRASLKKRIPEFPNDSKGEKAWLEELQFYANMKTSHTNFIVDYLLSQREENFQNRQKYKEFLETFSFDDFAFPYTQKNIRDKIISRFNEIIVNKTQEIKEEHEDRISNAVILIEALVKKLSPDTNPPLQDYISCSSINTALRTLFKAAIAKQLDVDEDSKIRIISALQAIRDKEAEIALEKTWRLFEWDSEEAAGIPSLTICLLNYLSQEIPPEVKSKPFWHGDSLVLAFNDNKQKKTTLSNAVIDFAENAVKVPEESGPGFYFLMRPSSRFASCKNSIIFTITYNAKYSPGKDNIAHSRIEAIKCPETQNWLFERVNSKEKPLPLNDFLKKVANNLPLKPVSRPQTQKQRFNGYFLHAN